MWISMFPLNWLQVTGNSWEPIGETRSLVTLPEKAGSSLHMHEHHPTFIQDKMHPVPELHVDDIFSIFINM